MTFQFPFLYSFRRPGLRLCQFLVRGVKHFVADVSISGIEPYELLKVGPDGFRATAPFLVEQSGQLQGLSRDAPEILFLVCSIPVFVFAELLHRTATAVFLILTQRCCIIHRSGLKCRLRYLIVVCFHLPRFLSFGKGLAILSDSKAEK